MFLPSLSLLTTHHKLLTLVLNGVVPCDYKPAYGHSRGKDDSDIRSVFASVGTKPALGKGVLGWADENLMVSKVVKGRQDAEGRYGEEISRNRVWEEVEVCECLTDRKGSRAGRWGCFEVIDGRLKTVSS